MDGKLPHLAGKRVLREAADHVIESCIQPRAEEVRGRWKHLFTNNGLMFQADASEFRASETPNATARSR